MFSRFFFPAARPGFAFECGFRHLFVCILVVAVPWIELFFLFFFLFFFFCVFFDFFFVWFFTFGIPCCFFIKTFYYLFILPQRKNSLGFGKKKPSYWPGKKLHHQSQREL